MKKLITAAAMGATLVAGSVAVATVSPLGAAVAQESGEAGGVPDAPGAPGGPGAALLATALDNLEAEGVLDAEQSQAVLDEVGSLAAQWREDHPGSERRGERREARRDARQETVAAVADVLGMTPEEVVAALRDGTSIADLAGEDLDAVVDALVAAGTERIDAAVEAGRLDPERAAELQAGLAERIEGLVTR